MDTIQTESRNLSACNAQAERKAESRKPKNALPTPASSLQPQACENLNLPETSEGRVHLLAKFWRLGSILGCHGAGPLGVLDEAIRQLEQARRLFGPPEHWDYFSELLEHTWCLYDDMQSGHLRVKPRSYGARQTLNNFRAWAQAWMDDWEQTPWDKSDEEPE